MEVEAVRPREDPPDEAMADDGRSDGICSEVLVSGTKVWAFYHANSNAKGFRFLRVAAAGASPLAGLSAGWLPGEVVAAPAVASSASSAEAEGAEARVAVRFEGPFCDPYEGTVDGIEMQVPASLVRPHAAGAAAAEPAPPLLSLLCVRWYDYWSSRWPSDYNVTSDQMLVDAFDGPCGPSEELPGEHEVHTVFVRRSEDLAAVSELWASVALRGKHRAAWYFLWPTATLPGAGGLRPGCVGERDFFALAQRMERAGIRTGWPHPSQLYRLLCGKLWVPQMCLNRDYRVPPTTRVHYQEFAADPSAAAASALERLQTLRREIWGEEPEPPESLRGVVKLGFSWQGKDVKPFRGAAELEAALRGLLAQPGSQQLVCLVQQMVPGVACELRVLAFRDAANGGFALRKVYMKLWDKSDTFHGSTDEFAMASGKVMLPEEAPAAFFAGDAAACASAEAQAEALARRWLLWFSTEFGPPCMTRLDFLVAQPEPGQLPTVWTCEVTECGSSLCNYGPGGRNAAALNFALEHEPAAGGRFPKKLPELCFHKAQW